MARPRRPDRISCHPLPLLAALLIVVAVRLGAGCPAEAAGATLTAADRNTYRLAFTAVDAGNWDEALRLGKRGRNPLPYKVIQWLYYTEPRSGAAFDAIAYFIRGHPQWPGERLLRRRAEEALDPDRLPDQEILAWFQAYPPVGIEGTIAYAGALERTGRPHEAGDLVRTFWTDGSFGSSQERGFLRRFGRHLTAREHRRRLDRLLWERQAGAAQRLLKHVSEDQRKLADARIRLMRQKAGVDAAVKRVPAHLANDPGLLFERMRWRRRKGLIDGAFDILDNPPPNLVDPDAWWKERNFLTREAMDRGDISLAYRVARDHRMDGGIGFATSEFLAGWISTRFLHDHPAGYRHFARLYRGVTFPISLSRGSYWAGRAAESAGDARLAIGWYETAAQFATTYYGQLAAAKLGTHVTLPTPRAPTPSALERRTFHAREMVQVIELLAGLGEFERIDPFFTRLAKSMDRPGEYVLLARLAEWAGRQDLALRAAKNAARVGVTLLDHSYPIVRLPDHVRQPEAALILALIRQESAYNPRAISRAGARGMMQLMPGTARAMAKRLGLAYSKAKLTEDVDYNITLGSSYLQGLLEKFDGSYIMALAAYNAGPGRVVDWVERNGHPHRPDVDPVDWVEMIPFSETRNYVQRILESVQVYRHRLSGARVALSLDKDLTR